MSQDAPPPRGSDVPDGWDRLQSAVDERSPEPRRSFPGATPQEPTSLIPVIAGSWGDLAVMLGLTAATLVALRLAGHGAPFAAAPWAIAVAVLWWLVAAAAVLTVRRATPGMAAAGISFAGAVAPARLPWVLLVALLLAATLGLPSAVGRPGWALRVAAGKPLIAAGHDLP